MSSSAEKPLLEPQLLDVSLVWCILVACVDLE